MARIRTIKPQFWTNEELSQVSESACLLAISLLNYSDDEGYFNANPKLVESACFPIRELSTNIRRAFDELSNIGYLEFAKSDDNRIYGRITKFSDHQKIDRPQKSKIIDLQLVWGDEIKFDEYSANNRRTFDVGIRNKEEVISKKEEEKEFEEKEFSETFVSVVEEKKEDSTKSSSKEKKNKKVAGGSPEFFSEAKKMFLQFFKEQNQTEYYFEAKDAKAIKGIEKQIEQQILDKKIAILNDESKIAGFRHFLKIAWMNGGDWIKANYSLPILNSKFSLIVSNFNTNRNGQSKQQTNDEKRAGRHALNDLAQQVVCAVDGQNY